MKPGDIFGRGLRFPVKVADDGRLHWAEGPDDIRQSIQIILLTEPGERLMLPTFGAGLRRFLFAPNNVATHRLVQERIEQALHRWEPRVRVQRVSVEADDGNPQAATATIHYTLVATQAPDQLTLQLDLRG